MTLQVFARSVRIQNSNDTWEMVSSIGDFPVEAQAFQRTTQCFTVLFLSSVGTDLSQLDSGGGFLDAIGRSQGSKDLAAWTLVASEAARRAHEEIVEEQRLDGISDDNELLEETRLLRVSMPAIDELDIEIQLVSRARQSSSFLLPVFL